MTEAQAQFNERTSVRVRATFRNEDGTLVVPNETPTYRVDDVDTGTPIVSERNIPGTLANTMEFVITRDQNGAHGNTRRFIRRRITVSFEYGQAGSPVAGGTEEVDFVLVNLSYHP